MKIVYKLLRVLTPVAALLLLTVFLSPEIKNKGDQDDRTVLHVGYSAGAFSKGFLADAQVALESLGSSIAKRSTETFEGVTATIHQDFESFKSAIEHEELDVVILSSLDYLTLESLGILEPELVARTSSGILKEYILLVPKEKDIRDISQLKGTSILIETGGSGRTPLVWLDVYLQQLKKERHEIFFGQTQNVEKASQAVLPVFFKKADACLTTLRGFQTMVELNPQVGEALGIVCRSPKLLRGLVCFRTGYDPKLKEIVVDILRNLHEDPDGQQMLIVMQEEKLVSFDPQYLESSKELFHLYNSKAKGR